MSLNFYWLDKKEEPYSVKSVRFFAPLLPHFEIIIFKNVLDIF